MATRLVFQFACFSTYFNPKLGLTLNFKYQSVIVQLQGIYIKQLLVPKLQEIHIPRARASYKVTAPEKGIIKLKIDSSRSCRMFLTKVNQRSKW